MTSVRVGILTDTGQSHACHPTLSVCCYAHHLDLNREDDFIYVNPFIRATQLARIPPHGSLHSSTGLE